jgi:Domain of unknown function (DUF4328)
MMNGENDADTSPKGGDLFYAAPMQPNPYAPPRDQEAASAQFSGAATLSHFRSASFAGKTTLAFMGICVASALVTRFFELLTWSQGRHLAWIDPIQKATRPIFGLLALGAVITFCIWIHRAASNVVALGRSGLRNSPASCVIWFFVPVANLFMPFLIVSQIAAASNNRGKAPLSVIAWWTSYMLSFFVGFITPSARRNASSNTVWVMMSASTFFYGIAFVALVFLILEIDRDQDARFTERNDAARAQ